MLNTEQIKSPQAKLQKTDSYQPVVAFLSSFIASCVVQFLNVCLTRSACTKKVNRHGAYNSVVTVAGFGILTPRPGSCCRLCSVWTRIPRLPRHIGRDERLKECTERPAVTDEGKGFSKKSSPTEGTPRTSGSDSLSLLYGCWI